jgi:hypothetical protein
MTANVGVTYDNGSHKYYLERVLEMMAMKSGTHPKVIELSVKALGALK